MARLRQRLLAASSTLPPLILMPGRRPSQAVNCLTVLKRDMSVPISLRIGIAVVTSVPSMRVKSTPLSC